MEAEDLRREPPEWLAAEVRRQPTDSIPSEQAQPPDVPQPSIDTQGTETTDRNQSLHHTSVQRFPVCDSGIIIMTYTSAE